MVGIPYSRNCSISLADSTLNAFEHRDLRIREMRNLADRIANGIAAQVVGLLVFALIEDRILEARFRVPEDRYFVLQFIIRAVKRFFAFSVMGKNPACTFWAICCCAL